MIIDYWLSACSVFCYYLITPSMHFSLYILVIEAHVIDLQITFHVVKQSHARVTSKATCLLFIIVFIYLFPFFLIFVLFCEALLLLLRYLIYLVYSYIDMLPKIYVLK